ncbi:hypothetical protein DFH08DRAFT_801005 [Mycena albidolilacea]|uniref:Uncharacterized protein n=1 Tax=Mycena albidolilacea TaxID=1033008 RepID=A0AAD7AHG1_9AGAR|nr:hypothetical protein DFH08DRAFT_801005 [Mycena albidolilacea]
MPSFNVLIAAAFIHSTLISASNPTPTLSIVNSIDGDFLPVNITAYNIEQAAAVSRQLPSTNAGRLARGLKLLPPKRRSGGVPFKAALPRRSASTPVTLTGNIQVLDTNGISLGRVYQTPNMYNHFGVSNTAHPITFHFTLDPTAGSTSQLSIYADSTSYASTWPLMGAIDGVVNDGNDLKSGSYNFAYIQGTNATPAESGPASVSNSYPTQEPAESAIWNYNTVTQEITAQWVNSNGDKPATAISFVAGSDALVITGDYGSFSSSFSSTQLVRLMFVPA